MERDLTFEPADGHAVVTTRGPFTVADHQHMVEDIVGRKEWHPGRSILFDHRQLELAGVHFAEMLQARENHAAQETRIGSARTAILTNPGADYGVMRQFELIAGESTEAELHVFTDEIAARKWLRSGG